MPLYALRLARPSLPLYLKNPGAAHDVLTFFMFLCGHLCQSVHEVFHVFIFLWARFNSLACAVSCMMKCFTLKGLKIHAFYISTPVFCSLPFPSSPFPSPFPFLPSPISSPLPSLYVRSRPLKLSWGAWRALQAHQWGWGGSCRFTLQYALCSKEFLAGQIV